MISKVNDYPETFMDELYLQQRKYRKIAETLIKTLNGRTDVILKSKSAWITSELGVLQLWIARGKHTKGFSKTKFKVLVAEADASNMREKTIIYLALDYLNIYIAITRLILLIMYKQQHTEEIRFIFNEERIKREKEKERIRRYVEYESNFNSMHEDS